VSAAAIGAHLLGGGGLLYANRGRAKHQSGVTSNTVAKIALTGAALGATIYSGILGAKTAQGDGHSVDGATDRMRPPRPTSRQRKLSCASCSGRCRCSPAQSSCSARSKASSSVPARFSPESATR
jgi:hypothetical protein